MIIAQKRPTELSGCTFSGDMRRQQCGVLAAPAAAADPPISSGEVTRDGAPKLASNIRCFDEFLLRSRSAMCRFGRILGSCFNYTPYQRLTLWVYYKYGWLASSEMKIIAEVNIFYLVTKPSTLKACNFAAFWLIKTTATVHLWKDLYPLVQIVAAQETSSILKIGFALSKWPHLHRAYLVIGPYSSSETVCKLVGTCLYLITIILRGGGA